jgi:hypothetical protein
MSRKTADGEPPRWGEDCASRTRSGVRAPAHRKVTVPQILGQALRTGFTSCQSFLNFLIFLAKKKEMEAENTDVSPKDDIPARVHAHVSHARPCVPHPGDKSGCGDWVSQAMQGILWLDAQTHRQIQRHKDVHGDTDTQGQTQGQRDTVTQGQTHSHTWMQTPIQ